MLGRDTEWRQGSLLTGEAAIALGLVDDSDLERLCVVISHDCDLGNDNEEKVDLSEMSRPVPLTRNLRFLNTAHANLRRSSAN